MSEYGFCEGCVIGIDHEPRPGCRYWLDEDAPVPVMEEDARIARLCDALGWALTWGDFSVAVDNPLHAGQLDRAWSVYRGTVSFFLTRNTEDRTEKS